MAQSTVKHPQAVMSELGQLYEVRDEEDILAFLERHPEVSRLLLEMRSHIRRFFGEDPVRLEVLHDPEWPEDEPELVANIQTPFRSQEALQRLHQLYDEWWLEKLREHRVPVIVSIEHRRV